MTSYREQLPNGCPKQSNHPNEKKLWRLIMSNTVVDADFDSEIKRNPSRLFKDSCYGYSVSLQTSFQAVSSLAKSPFLKKRNFTHAAGFAYDTNVGVWQHDHNTHVHFWPYSNFSVQNTTFDVRAI